MKAKNISNTILAGIIIVFILAFIGNVLSVGFSWLGELVSPSTPQITSTNKEEDPFTERIARPREWLKNPIPVEPGFDNKIRTAPRGKSLIVVVRDENLEEFDRFTLGNTRGVIEKPRKKLLPDKSYFLDFQPVENEEFTVIVWRIPL